MVRTPVVSTNLASVGYDPEAGILEVEFIGGSVYEYYLVPPEVYPDLVGARSPGTAFERLVRGRYRFRRVA
jgi:hypothetical protein